MSKDSLQMMFEFVFKTNIFFSYFNAVRNDIPPPTDPRFKPAFPNLLPNANTPNTKQGDNKKPEFSVLHPFASASMFPPLIDMSTTQTLLAMVRTAKEAELQVSSLYNRKYKHLVTLRFRVY